MKRFESLKILGVMTGTSCDALDAACLEFSTDGWRPLWQDSATYPAELRTRVLAIQKNGSRHTLLDVLELNRDLGAWYGDTIHRLCGLQNEKLRPDAIANHGQTVAHFPVASRKGSVGTSLQLGDPALLASQTQLTIISQFRQGDLASGGQGAPLVPAFHRLIATQLPEAGAGLAIHNIGGISNLTYFSEDDELLAFDTGPGNAWIDAATAEVTRGKQKMDRGGVMAQQGRVDERAVKEILKHPFFKKIPPKSTGRDDFPYELLRKATRKNGVDLVTTATAVTVESIARAYERFILAKKRPLTAIYICGGGAKNPAIVKTLQIRLPNCKIKTLSSAGIDGQWIEAQAFAFFGFLSLMGRSYSGEWTGATSPYVPPGNITPGRNWRALLSKLTAFTG